MLTDRDYQLLSDYLDDALASSERVILESRLQTEAELRAELEAVGATVSLLNNLPARKAPRNFTLDARFARRPAARWLVFPTTAAFSALSAAAAVLLIALSSILLTRNSASQPLPTVVGEQAAQEQQSAFSPTQVDENNQKLSREELEATATALSSTLPEGDNNLDGFEAGTSPPQPSSASGVTNAPIPPVAQEGAGQATNTQPLATQTILQLFTGPAEANAPSPEAALSSVAEATAMPQDGALTFGTAQEEETAQAEDTIADAAAGAADSANFAPPLTPTLAATLTGTSTAVAMLPTESVLLDEARDQRGVSDPLPLLLLAAGLTLLGMAISTTLVRRRGR